MPHVWKLKPYQSERDSSPFETSLMTNSPDKNCSASRSYVDPQLLFSLEIPAGWLIDNTGQQGSKVVVFDPKSDANFRTNINVIVQDLEPLTEDECLTFGRLQLKQISGNSKLDLDEPAKDSRSPHLFEVTSRRTPVPLKCRQAVWVSQGKVYIVSGTTTASQFPLRREEFNAVLKSFRILSVQR